MHDEAVSPVRAHSLNFKRTDDLEKAYRRSAGAGIIPAKSGVAVMAPLAPDEGTTPEAAREQIARLDRTLISILHQRHLYEERIAELRGGLSHPEVAAHFLEFMKDRRKWGRQHGIDADFIDRIFATIAQRYFDRRLAEARSQRQLR